MSITTDLKNYADQAVAQGKQALEQAVEQAQAQLNDVTGQANDLVGKVRENAADIADKATDAANDLRASAEKAVNVDAIRSAIDPYLTQVLGYTSTVTERAESLIAEARKDKRVQSLIEAVEELAGQVEEKVVKPVLSFVGQKPAAQTRTAPAPKPAAKPAAKPASATPTARSTAKPAAKKATARKTTARKATKA